MEKKASQSLIRRHKLLSIIGVTVAILMLDVLFIGNAAYYTKWAQCGRQPVIVRHPISVGFGAAPERDVAYTQIELFEEKKPLLFDIGNASIYCTLEDAQEVYGLNLEVIR